MDETDTTDALNHELSLLNEEQRVLVLDYVRSLRQRPELALPESLHGPEHDEWLRRVEAHATRTLADLRTRMEAAGIPPDGDLPRHLWPADMAADSKTSVAT